MAKRNSGGGGVGRFIAVILALIVGAGVVFGIIYRKHVAVVWNKAMNFFGRVDDEVKEGENAGDENETPSDGESSTTVGQLQMGTSEENGISLAMVPLLASEYEENGVSPQAESAVNITATVTPDYATDKTLKWELSFVPQNEEQTVWAQDKDIADYMAIRTQGTSKHSASLENYLPLGAQVELKVSSISNPEVYTTLKIDYAKRFKGAKILFDNGVNEESEIVLDTYGKDAYIVDSTWAEAYMGTISLVEETTDASVGNERSLTFRAQIDPGFRRFCAANYNIPMIMDEFATITLTEGTEFSFIYAGLYFVAGTESFEEALELYGNKYRGAVNAWTGGKYMYVEAYGASGANGAGKTFYETFVYDGHVFDVDVEDVTTDSGDIVF